MTPQTFLEHFETFAAAPNGIAKLREMILQLAVQGKLGALDVSYVDAGLSQCEEKSWQTLNVETAVSDFAEIQNGYAFKSQWFVQHGVRLVRNVNVGHDELRWDEAVHVTSDIAQQFDRFNLAEGDIVISLDRPLITTGLKVARVGRNDIPCLLLQRVGRVVFKREDVLPEYFFLWLHSPAFTRTIDPGRSNGVPHISAREIEAIPFSLPPLAEQRRIVEKVDQLLGLCDELAARQAAQREKRQRLVGATLDRLVSPQTSRHLACRGGLTASAPLDTDTTGAKANEPPGQARWRVMQDDAHRLRNHFDQLFDTPTTIPELRQTILQLAVQGQLVPQDSDDEPAEDLLRRIVDEKKRLQEAGEFKLQDGSVPIADKEKLFTIPPSWKWVRAADLSFPISSGSTPAKDVFQVTSENGVPYLKVYNIRNQKIDFEYCPQFIRKPHHDAKMKRSKLVPGMVVLNIVGPPLGKTAIVPPTFPEWNCNQAIAFFRFIGDVLPEYIHLYFCAGLFLRNIELIGTAGQDNISVTKCKNIVIPLPPLAEQKRIVTKVTELLSLCDALEAKLTQAESASTQLLSAAIHSILIGSK